MMPLHRRNYDAAAEAAQKEREGMFTTSVQEIKLEVPTPHSAGCISEQKERANFESGSARPNNYYTVYSNRTNNFSDRDSFPRVNKY